MRSKALSRALIGCALLFALQGVAVAQPKDAGLRECFGNEISMEELEMGCVKTGDGPWQRVERPGGGSGMFGTFLFFGLLLALVPGFVGVSVSKDAGVSPLVGFAIGLFGSWIGVIVLYLGGQSQRQGKSAVITLGSSPAAAPAEGMGPAVGATRPSAPREPGTAPEPTGVAERLRALKDLLDQGLITQEEYDTRRAAAIDSL